LQQVLDAAIAKESKGKATANLAESSTRCQELEMECIKMLDAGSAVVQFPSMHQYESRHAGCMKRFEVGGHLTAAGWHALASADCSI
jgi:hypothetical protein